MSLTLQQHTVKHHLVNTTVIAVAMPKQASVNQALLLLSPAGQMLLKRQGVPMQADLPCARMTPVGMDHSGARSMALQQYILQQHIPLLQHYAAALASQRQSWLRPTHHPVTIIASPTNQLLKEPARFLFKRHFHNISNMSHPRANSIAIPRCCGEKKTSAKQTARQGSTGATSAVHSRAHQPHAAGDSQQWVDHTFATDQRPCKARSQS